ncbi:hypothetical protein BaRGS_00032888, partial [Batillaria attramentaria]
GIAAAHAIKVPSTSKNAAAITKSCWKKRQLRSLEALQGDRKKEIKDKQQSPGLTGELCVFDRGFINTVSVTQNVVKVLVVDFIVVLRVDFAVDLLAVVVVNLVLVNVLILIFDIIVLVDIVVVLDFVVVLVVVLTVVLVVVLAVDVVLVIAVCSAGVLLRVLVVCVLVVLVVVVLVVLVVVVLVVAVYSSGVLVLYGQLLVKQSTLISQDQRHASNETVIKDFKLPASSFWYFDLAQTSVVGEG